MHAYPGRTFGQLYHRFFRTNDLADGRLVLGERTLELAEVYVPVLADGGDGDGSLRSPPCHHVAELLPGAPAVRLETAPGRPPGRADRAGRARDDVGGARPLPRRALIGRRRAAPPRPHGPDGRSYLDGMPRALTIALLLAALRGPGRRGRRTR